MNQKSLVYMCLIGLNLFNRQIELKMKSLKINHYLFNPNLENDWSLFNQLTVTRGKGQIVSDMLFNLNPENQFRP